MLVDVGSEGLFVFVRQTFEVSSILQEFNDCLFDICEGKEFFYAHFLCNNCFTANDLKFAI